MIATASTPTVDEIADWLRLMIDPDGACEVRAIFPRGKVESRVFPPGTDPRTIATHALEVDGRHPRGVYLALNALRPDGPAIGRGKPATDADVMRRRRLLIDIDPTRPPDTNATDAERDAALGVAEGVRAELHRRDWPEPIDADSGNGWHIVYGVDLPNDDAAKDLVRDVLKALATRFDTAAATVDTKVFNAARISKLYGTTARKGRATAERPHRPAVVLSAPDRLEPVPVALLEELASEVRTNLQIFDGSKPPPPPQANGHANGRRPDAETRAVAYLAKCEPAVSGRNGHGKTFGVACKVGPGFDLPPDVSLRLIREHYNPRCEPPWSDRELEHKVQDAYRVEVGRGFLLNRDRPDYRANGKATSEMISLVASSEDTAPTPDVGAVDAELATHPRTDSGNAERLVKRHGDVLRHCHPWGKWLVWDGRRWTLDHTAAVRRLAKGTARRILAEASTIEDDDRRKAHAQWALTSEGRAKRDNMLALASAEDGIPILPDEMDRDPWAFNVANGTIDLRTGELRPHRREDLITKLAPVAFDPAAECPLWLSTLHLFFSGNPDLIDYFQRLCGYAIAGTIRDHVMPICYGVGSNGKSTILGALLEVVGSDYGMKAPPDLLMAKRNEAHPTERADLFGKRLVVAIETEAGGRLSETLVKELTGGDRIRARRMREDHWEFTPSHTLFLATNHKPTIRGTDKGIWRRLKLVPFTVSVEGEGADKAMPEKLRAERAGILAWCVRGCLAWQERGLEAPADVIDATETYRSEQDVLGGFLEEFTLRVDGARVKASQLYAAYREWADSANEFTMSMKAFSLALQERGFETKRSDGIWYLGIGLRREGGSV